MRRSLHSSGLMPTHLMLIVCRARDAHHRRHRRRHGVWLGGNSWGGGKDGVGADQAAGPGLQHRGA